MVLTPRCWRQVREKQASWGRRWQQSRSPGRARRKPLKPLRGECRAFSGVTVVTTVCFLPFARGLRAHRAPGIPCALSSEGRNVVGKTRTKCVARSRDCVGGQCCLKMESANPTSANVPHTTRRPGERRDPYAEDFRFGYGVATMVLKSRTPGDMGPGLRRDDEQGSRLLRGENVSRRRPSAYSSSCFLPPMVFSLANTASTLRSSRCFSDGSNSGSLRVVSEAGSRVAPP